MIQACKIWKLTCRALQSHLLTMTLRILMPYHVFSLRFWLLVWRKWRNLNSTLSTSSMLKVTISKYKQTPVFDDHTVMLLSEDIFSMSTVPNLEFHLLDLQWWKWFFDSVRAVCEATWLELFQPCCLTHSSHRIWIQIFWPLFQWNRGQNICIRITLFTNFFYDLKKERQWPHRAKKRCISVTSDCIVNCLNELTDLLFWMPWATRNLVATTWSLGSSGPKH